MGWRSIPWLIVAGLLFATFWCKKQQDLAQKKVSALTDTLVHFQQNQSTTGQWWVPGLDSIIGQKELELGDSLIEIHRIIWRLNTYYAFTIRQKKDSSVWLAYKHYSIKNPLTGYGRNQLLSEKTMLVSPVDFSRFRQQLSAVPFFDAAPNENMICCWTTGSLGWEARFQKEGHLSYFTFCRQSVQFAEACEMILRLVDDPDLQRPLGRL